MFRSRIPLRDTDSVPAHVSKAAAPGSLKPVWHFQMGGSVYAAPMAFAVDGKEYVAIAAGSAVYAFGLQ